MLTPSEAVALGKVGKPRERANSAIWERKQKTFTHRFLLSTTYCMCLPASLREKMAAQVPGNHSPSSSVQFSPFIFPRPSLSYCISISWATAAYFSSPAKVTQLRSCPKAFKSSCWSNVPAIPLGINVAVLLLWVKAHTAGTGTEK